MSIHHLSNRPRLSRGRAAKMVSSRAFPIVLSLWILSLLALEASAATKYNPPSPPLAKPNCTNKCGNVTIPFPFGIGQSRCFLNSTYEVVCDQNGTVPVLKRLGLEVLDITLPGYYPAGDPIVLSEYRRIDVGTIQVRQPIIYQNCSGRTNTTSNALDMEGAPFYFSSTDNIFGAVGCNNLAVMASTDSAIMGCRSSCNGTTTQRYSSCDGLDCCRTSITSGLQDYSIDFKPADDEGPSEGCKYAFIAEQQWFGQDLRDLDTLRDMDFVPVVLDWTVEGSSLTAIGLSASSYGLPYTCDRYSISTNASRSLYTCYCDMGYLGNALLNNCQDIDECEDPNICSSRCVNRPGSFICKGRPKVAQFVAMGIGIGLGAILLFLLAMWLCRVIRRRKEMKLKQGFFKRNGGLLLQQEISSSAEGNYVEKTRIFTTNELEKATDNFNRSRVLGQGGQGTVYKGMLEDGRIVAIKKSIAMESGGVEQFINEVVILSQINHRNVVKLLGCCLETEVPLLVYEFIPNGTLYHHLHNPIGDLSLSWEMRLRIAWEVAGALYYLHSATTVPVYHRDIKSSNIMLDEKYRAKVADFGTSKSVAWDRTHVTTQVQGTFGYLDPEYFQSSQFTDKSDVYSFGVVLAELLTGQRPISRTGPEEHRGLATYFVISMEQDRLFEILDGQVKEQGGEEEITEVAKLALRCLNLSGRKRPAMREVVAVLENLRMSRNGSDGDGISRGGPVDAGRTESFVRSWDDFSTGIFTTIDVNSIASSDALLRSEYQKQVM